MSENRIECPLCRTGTYPHFGYTGSGNCDHCGAEWAYDETDTLTDNAMRALWEKIPRWIPIDESLPDVDDHVLIFCPLLEPEETTCADRQANGMWVCDDGQMLGATEPTYWMPLPPTPTPRTSNG